MSYFVFIHQNIDSFQVPVDYVILMQVIHSLGHINCYFEQGWKLKTALLLMQKVIDTSTKHKL